MSDAAKMPELIHQGSGAEGLRAARRRGVQVLPGYPRNGCAVHLSALLEQAEIEVTITRGAGKLARMVERRGWRRISIGEQVPGDIGVTYDNDPSPPGADHVYLVIEVRGMDGMMVADNQRPADAPHRCFASGRGKTQTEYFLRA